MDNFVLRMPALYSPTYAKQCAPLVTFNPVFNPSPVDMPRPDGLYPGRYGFLPDPDSDVSTVTFEREVLQRSGSFDALSADDTDLELAVSQLRIYSSEQRDSGRQLAGAWFQTEEAGPLRDRLRPFSYLDPLGAPEYPRYERREGREQHERRRRHGRQERLDWPPIEVHERQPRLEYPAYDRQERQDRQERRDGRERQDRQERRDMQERRDGQERRGGLERRQERQQHQEYRDWQESHEQQERQERQERKERQGRQERRDSRRSARPTHVRQDSDTSTYDIPPRVLRPTKPMTTNSWREHAQPPPQENIYETPRQAWPPTPPPGSPTPPIYASLEPRRGGVPRTPAAGSRAPPERGRPSEPPPPPPQQLESEYMTILAHSESSTELPAAICQESETSSGEEEREEEEPDTTATDATPGREALRDGSELWAGNEVRRLPPERREGGRQRRAAGTEEEPGQKRKDSRSRHQSEVHTDRRETRRGLRQDESTERERETREARSRRRALLGARSRLLSSLRRGGGRSRSAGPAPSSRQKQASSESPHSSPANHSTPLSLSLHSLPSLAVLQRLLLFVSADRRWFALKYWLTSAISLYISGHLQLPLWQLASSADSGRPRRRRPGQLAAGRASRLSATSGPGSRRWRVGSERPHPEHSHRSAVPSRRLHVQLTGPPRPPRPPAPQSDARASNVRHEPPADTAAESLALWRAGAERSAVHQGPARGAELHPVRGERSLAAPAL